mgnify:CR=1 FL=1
MIAHLFFKIKTYLNYHLKAVNAHGLHSPFLFDFYNEVIAAKKEFYFFKQFREILSVYTKFICVELLTVPRIYDAANQLIHLHRGAPNTLFHADQRGGAVYPAR